MKSDQAIQVLVEALKKRRTEILEDIEADKHDCDCEYCTFEPDTDQSEVKRLSQEIDDIDRQLLRYQSLKLSEKS